MKFVLKTFVILFLAVPGYSVTNLQFRCVRANPNEVLTGYINYPDIPSEPTRIHGLSISGSLQEQIDKDFGYSTISKILNSSSLCKDLRTWVGIRSGSVFTCKSEFIAPGGVYGQILTSSNGPHVLLKEIAPEQGWQCEIGKFLF